MKRLLSALCLALLLTGCSAPASTPAPADHTAQEAAQALLNSAAFSEHLEVVDSTIAAMLYGLEGEQILDGAAYLSTGATAEECTFLIVADEKAALEVLQQFQLRVEDQLLAVENYQPAEVPKLKDAIHGSFALAEGVMAYLIVPNNATAAQDAVDALIS